MDEDKTFRILKRKSFEDTRTKIDATFKEGSKISPVYKLGSVVVERNTYYNPLIIRHYQLIKILEDYGWTLEEFALESEKRSIIEQVKEYNENLEFPQEIIERAKQFFPNVKFTPAKLELD